MPTKDNNTIKYNQGENYPLLYMPIWNVYSKK